MFSHAFFPTQPHYDFEPTMSIRLALDSLLRHSSAQTQSHVPVSYTHLTLPTICSVQISVVAVSLKKKKKKQQEQQIIYQKNKKKKMLLQYSKQYDINIKQRNIILKQE
eukprot:TRINITY_DN135_c0_g2_i2.p2 TRINITY_DN135_c0_g2~~TRINITY_DN135_c0_g2_i2.p2  ORF type:complete len:109 (+),score=17.98 TRINITY_DN135_c0_g2_i2:577-903(+)